MNDLEQARKDLRLLAASDSKVRIGFTTTTGASDKTDPMTATDAIVYLEAMVNTLHSFGIAFRSLTVYRFEN